MSGVSAAAQPHGLLWLDLETTGLDAQSDRILEIACRLTSFAFPYEDVLGPETGAPIAGSFVVRHYWGDPRVEESVFALKAWMDARVLEMHTASGLLEEVTAAALDPEVPGEAEIGEVLTELAAGWPEDPAQRVVLAGSSVHFDLQFLRRKYPKFAARLSYRVFDVSAIAMFCRSLGMPRADVQQEPAHRAAEDLAYALAQARRCEAWLRQRGQPNAPDVKGGT